MLLLYVFRILKRCYFHVSRLSYPINIAIIMIAKLFDSHHRRSLLHNRETDLLHYSNTCWILLIFCAVSSNWMILNQQKKNDFSYILPLNSNSLLCCIILWKEQNYLLCDTFGVKLQCCRLCKQWYLFICYVLIFSTNICLFFSCYICLVSLFILGAIALWPKLSKPLI